jgi:hypothetical protein
MTGTNSNPRKFNLGMVLLSATVLLFFAATREVTADIQPASSVVASAGGQAASTNFTMKSTLGQSTPKGPSGSTNFGVGAGFWYQDPIAPSNIGDLTATLSVSDIVLEWSHAKDNVAINQYVVYRATMPYFGSTSGDSIGATKGAMYQDLEAAGDSLTNYFYVVKAVDRSRNLAEDSNRVGEFDAGLVNEME